MERSFVILSFIGPGKTKEWLMFCWSVECYCYIYIYTYTCFKVKYGNDYFFLTKVTVDYK